MFPRCYYWFPGTLAPSVGSFRRVHGDGSPPWGKAEGMGCETGWILSECLAAEGTPGNEGEDEEEEEGKLEGGSRHEGEPEEAGA